MSNQNKTPFGNYSFLPAVLKENTNDWYIEYYSENPQTKQMKRFRVRMNRIVKKFKRKSDARKCCLETVHAINLKLSEGWSPFFEGEDARLYTPLADVVAKFILEKKKETREKTIEFYRNTLNRFTVWVNNRQQNTICSMFGKQSAICYLDHIYNETNISARSYNSILKVLKCFFNWSITHGYAKENVFLQFKPKREETKKRILIDASARRMIVEKVGNCPFLLFCMLIYHSLIRPNELLGLKIGDINLKNHIIKVGSDIAKNHKERESAISQQIESLINVLGIMNYPKSNYIFSESATMLPGKKRLNDDTPCRKFRKIREELKLPKTMQLYSFRDTGIFEMLKSNVDDLSVMQHADHSSLNITSVYAKHHDPNLTKIINEKTPKF